MKHSMSSVDSPSSKKRKKAQRAGQKFMNYRNVCNRALIILISLRTKHIKAGDLYNINKVLFAIVSYAHNLE